MPQRTITLTGRPPVKIEEDNWPVIASAKDSWYDSEHEHQANETSDWGVRVRKHQDGRAIVYATYFYSTNSPRERNLSAKAGVLLPAGNTDQAICDAIAEVCRDIADADHHGNDADRWHGLATECIADMPAEELA